MSLLLNKKRGNHHWWPKGIQRHWVNSDGQLYRRKDGVVALKNPKSGRTGCSRNAHFIDLGGGPWSHSFEDAFNTTDSKGAVAVDSAIATIEKNPIYKLSRARLTSWWPFTAHATVADFECLNVNELHALARLSIALVVRSPAFQFRKSFLHPAFFPNGGTSALLGKQSIWDHWSDLFRESDVPIEPVSMFFLIASMRHEFVIGDGFYENVIDRKKFVTSKFGKVRPVFDGELLLPLSPEVCVLICFNADFGQKIAILSREETTQINEITCLSSRREIYFRSIDCKEFSSPEDASARQVVLGRDFFLSTLLDTFAN